MGSGWCIAVLRWPTKSKNWQQFVVELSERHRLLSRRTLRRSYTLFRYKWENCGKSFGSVDLGFCSVGRLSRAVLYANSA